MFELENLPLLSSVRDHLTKQLSSGPFPMQGRKKQTSAKKRKSLTKSEFETLDTYLKSSKRRDDWLIRCFLSFGIALFLRPVEYLAARVQGTVLIVRNAKATNGRANGEFRKRDIAALGARAIAGLELFLRRLKKAASANSWKNLHHRLASRLARICKKLGIDRVSLYTLRHAGISTAKTWMTPEEVAAAAGHGSVHTATSHYAKRRTGWHGMRLAGKPLPESIALVRGTPRFFRPKSPENRSMVEPRPEPQPTLR